MSKTCIIDDILHLQCSETVSRVRLMNHNNSNDGNNGNSSISEEDIEYKFVLYLENTLSVVDMFNWYWGKVYSHHSDSYMGEDNSGGVQEGFEELCIHLDKTIGPISTLGVNHDTSDTSTGTSHIPRNISPLSQRTLVLIKPEMILANKDTKNPNVVNQILQKIVNDTNDLTVITYKLVMVTAQIASIFYEMHRRKEYYTDLIDYMSTTPTDTTNQEETAASKKDNGAPCLVLILEGPNCILRLLALLGHKDPVQAKRNNPTSLRALYGTDMLRNAVHGSEDEISAYHEISFWTRHAGIGTRSEELSCRDYGINMSFSTSEL